MTTPINTEKLANLVAIGTSESDICDILGLSLDELSTARGRGDVQAAVMAAKQERHELHNDLNTAWDKIEQLGAAATINTLRQAHCDPEFALRAASMANKMQRRAPGAGQAIAQPINAQQNNVVVIRLNQRFSKALEDGLVLDAIDAAEEPVNGKNGHNGHRPAETVLTDQGLPKHIDSLPLRDAEKLLIPVDEQERREAVDELLEDQLAGMRPQRTMDERKAYKV